MKGSLLVVVLLIGSFGVKGQEFSKEIKIGDRLPMSELHNMINHPSKTLLLADHKADLTILDIWSTNCGGCVVAWPKMLELQKEFGKNLQVILVNRFQDEKVVKDFISYRKKMVGVDMNLPISCQDTALARAFPRPGVPRYYWIDSNGVVVSATHGDQVTRANVKRWIESGPFRMDQIVEDMARVDGTKPIFVDGNGGVGRSDAFVWSSSLTHGFRDIVGTARDFTGTNNTYGILVTGYDIRTLYRTAYNNLLAPSDELTFVHDSRCVVIAEDSSIYYGWINGVRTSAPRYNYQLIAGRPMARQRLQGAMQEDLDRYFGLTATWEKRRKNCLVITMFDSTKAQQKSRGYGTIVGETQTGLDGATVHEAIYWMEQGSFFYDPRPIVDETGYKGILTGIYFEARADDVKALDRAFSRFGIHINEEVREVDVLVLREP